MDKKNVLNVFLLYHLFLFKYQHLPLAHISCNLKPGIYEWEEIWHKRKPYLQNKIFFSLYVYCIDIYLFALKIYRI